MNITRATKSFRKGWNSGVQAAVSTFLSAKGLGSREEIAEVLQPLLMPPPQSLRSDSQTAKKYGISKRTVLNWRKDGCPFLKGQGAVLDWMAGRRYLPAEAERKFKRQLARRRLRAMLVELDDSVIEVQALAKVHRELGLAVEPWMRLRRLTRRKAVLPVAEVRKEILRRLAGLE